MRSALLHNERMSPKKEQEGRSPEESSVTMTELVLPQNTNALGSIFGGTVMGWIDIAAAIAAGRHARKIVVTASVDALNFKAPIRLGQVVVIKASVNRAFNTSIEVGVRVDSEDQLTGKTYHNVNAYLTFVALDQTGKPTAVPPVLVKTPVEKRRYDEALKRKEARMKLKQEIGNEFE